MRHHLELEIEALIARGMNPAEARRRGAPPLRQRRAGQGRLPRFMGPAGDRHPPAGRALRRTLAREVSRLHRGRPADTRARHRREHGDLQRGARRAAAAAAVHARRSPRRGAPAGAADRRRERRRVGQGDRRLPGADAVARHHRRVPPDVVQPARPRRSVARADRRGLARVLRRARRQADARPHVPGRGRFAQDAPAVLVRQLRVLAERARRRSRHRRSHVRDERPRAHRGRRPAADSAVSRRERRLHAAVGVPVPIQSRRRSPTGRGGC